MFGVLKPFKNTLYEVLEVLLDVLEVVLEVLDLSCRAWRWFWGCNSRTTSRTTFKAVLKASTF